MKFSLSAAGLALVALALPADAANLCNCCGASTTQSCAASCAAVKPPQGQCQATVDYTATAEIGPGVNPLYGISLRNMDLRNPNGTQLEALRRLLENSRHAAEQDRRSAWHDYESGKIDAAALKAANKRYDDALVNYFLGWNSYRHTPASK